MKYTLLLTTYMYAVCGLVFSYNECYAEDFRFRTYGFPEFHRALQGFFDMPNAIKTNTSIKALRVLLETNNVIYSVSAARRIGQLRHSESEKILLDYLKNNKKDLEKYWSAMHEKAISNHRTLVSAECYRQLNNIGAEDSYFAIKNMVISNGYD